MSSPAVTLAKFALIEARRSGLPWIAAASVLAAVGAAGFVAQVAITESLALQAALAAALLRACAVFIVAAHVTASTLREANDKVLELMLSLPVSRATYYLGKLLGFAVCAGAISATLALPLLIWNPAGTVSLWAVSLGAETLLVAAAALFFAAVLGQVASALAATLGLYFLARAIGAIQAIARGPLAADTLLQQAARWIVDAIALLLPRLDAATRTEWLLYGAPAATEFVTMLAGLALYAALLAAAGLFDFYRRSQ